MNLLQCSIIRLFNSFPSVYLPIATGTVFPGTDLCHSHNFLRFSGGRVRNIDKHRIGYASLASLKDNVKVLTVGGIAPTEETVKDGSYVIQRPFILVTKDGVELSETAKKFFDYATSSQAAEVITAAGAVPVN